MESIIAINIKNKDNLIIAHVNHKKRKESDIEEEYIFKYDGNKISEIEIFYMDKSKGEKRLLNEGHNPIKMMLDENSYQEVNKFIAKKEASRYIITMKLEWEKKEAARIAEEEAKAKAKEVRKAAEKLITRAKVDSVHNRREAAKFIQDEIVLAKLFTNIGLRMKDRNGGYTRMLKLGFRQGDAADIVILELVDYQLDSDNKSSKKDDKKKADGKKATSKKAAEKKSTAKKSENADAPVAAE